MGKVYNMWIILAIINIVLAFLAENNYQKSRFLTLTFLGSIVVVNTFFIGLRDFGVGVDTTVYIDEYFNNAALINSFEDFLFDESLDKGFVALAYISHLFSDSRQSLLVVTELFITTFIVLGVYEYKKTINFSFAGFFLLFWLLYQQETTNLMRQFCAMSLLFYGFAKLLQKNYFLFLFLCIIAYFFHSSTILFSLVLLGYFLSKTDSKLKYLLLLLPVLGAYYVYNNFYALLYYAGDLNLVSEIYTDRYGELSPYDGSTGHVNLKFLVPSILVFLVFRYKLLHKQEFYMLLFLLITTFLLEQTKFISQYFFRMSYYSGIVFIVYFSIAFKKRYWKKLLYVQIPCIIALFYYAYQNYTFMESSTIGFMYRSKILGID